MKFLSFLLSLLALSTLVLAASPISDQDLVYLSEPQMRGLLRLRGASDEGTDYERYARLFYLQPTWEELWQVEQTNHAGGSSHAGSRSHASGSRPHTSGSRPHASGSRPHQAPGSHPRASGSRSHASESAESILDNLKVEKPGLNDKHADKKILEMFLEKELRAIGRQSNVGLGGGKSTRLDKQGVIQRLLENSGQICKRKQLEELFGVLHPGEPVP